MPDVKFKISNLAPITSIDKTISFGSIDGGFFARNGCGKTYISRIFELLASKGTDDYNKFIRKGENSCSFEFSVDNVENIQLKIERDYVPAIPDTNYIYHVFNEDYTENHYKENYNKDGNIEGVILGKEKKAVDDKIEEIKKTKLEQQKIINYISEKIYEEYKNELSSIPYLTRLKEFNEWINFEYINKNYSTALSKKYDFKYQIDIFNKLSAIPDNIQIISYFQSIPNDLSGYLNEDFLKCMQFPYTLAELGEEFRNKISNKENFIKSGVELIVDNKCPFCEKPLEDVKDLINQYNKYIEDTENKVKTYLNGIKNKLLQKSINVNIYTKIYQSFNDYKQRYIPNFSKKVELIDSTSFNKCKDEIIGIIDIKIKDITKPQNIDIGTIINSLISLNKVIDENNIVIKEFNKILENSNSQKQQTKRDIVNDFYFYLCDKYQQELKQTTKYNLELVEFNTELSELKKEAKTIKKVVGETTKTVINKFFGDKYSFNSTNFKLNFNNSELKGDEPKKVLSQGERSLLTFAYYLGEAHQKIKQDEANYNKLFFIIDDPISSLDFDNVFAVADIIKDINTMFNMRYKRIFVFTHNFEFIRKLKSNNAISQSYEIYDNSIRKLKGNLCIDYYSHLSDIYNMNIGTNSNFHTIGNSIRQVLEGIAKFENPNIEKNITKEYIENNVNIKNNISNVLIQDLSHGNVFSSVTIGSEEWIELCKNIINHILIKYPKQIEYIKTLND